MELNEINQLTQDQIDAGFVDIVSRATLKDIIFYTQFVQNPNIQETKYKTYPVQGILKNSEDAETQYKIMKTVLSKNPNVSVKDAGGRVVAMEAFDRDQRGIGLMLLEAMVKNGNDLGVQDEAGDGLLNHIVGTGSEKLIRKALALRVPYLINNKKEGALFLAAQKGDVDSIEAIIQGLWARGENPKEQTDFKKAFDVAYAKKNEEMQQALNREKIPAESLALYAVHEKVLAGKIKYTETAQDFAERFKKLPFVDQKWVKFELGLPEKDGEIQEWSKKVAAHLKNEDVPALLSEVLFNQINKGTVRDVSVFLKLGANPNKVAKTKQTPLIAAIGSTLSAKDHKQNDVILPESTPYDKAELLLRAGADPQTISNGQVPFLWSLAKNRVGISALLLSAVKPHERAKMVQERDGYKNGALKYAAENSNPSGIKLVLDNGGDLYERGSQGKLAMYWAIDAGKPGNVMALWDSGFKLDLDSKEGLEMQALLEKRKNKWDIPLKTGKNGEKPPLSDAQKEEVRAELYQDMIKAISGMYQAPQKPTKKKVEIRGEKELDQKVAGLTAEEAAYLVRLVSIYLPELPKEKVLQTGPIELVPETQPVASSRTKKGVRALLEGVRDMYRKSKTGGVTSARVPFGRRKGR